MSFEQNCEIYQHYTQQKYSMIESCVKHCLELLIILVTSEENTSPPWASRKVKDHFFTTNFKALTE